jgi:deazaflavin-dependent oxidoreductase (nitroreductase family)
MSPAAMPLRPTSLAVPFDAAPVFPSNKIKPGKAPVIIADPGSQLRVVGWKRGLSFRPHLIVSAGEGGMSSYREAKHRIVTVFQRRIGNPILMRMPGHTLLETTGRRSGLPRRTPLGGRLVGRDFWLVSEYGEKSQYVRNIQADPRVRVRIRGRWRVGIAHLMPEDDAKARLRSLPMVNSAGVRLLGTNLLTVRVELAD